MHEPDAPDFWPKDFVAAMRLIGSATERLPYGVPEPILGGLTAMELYSGGLWPTPQVELLTDDAPRLQAELTETGFRLDECSPSGMRTLWHPALDRRITIAVRPSVEANVVAVKIESNGRNEEATIRVVGIEDLIADQIASWLRPGNRRSEVATLVQVLVELGRSGVAGPFRQAYLQRRLDRETKGEAVLELPPASYCLDDPSPRMTSLTAISSVVRRWRSRRNLSLDATEPFERWHQKQQGSVDVSRRNEALGQDGLPVVTAQIIPFVPSRR